MPATLEVDLNADEPYAVEVAEPAFRAEGSFEILLHNHGTALHVHLHLDDDLSRAARLGAANHFVEPEEIARARVRVDESRLPTEGRLKIVTGYGARTKYVTVKLEQPHEVESRVRVAERLARPRPRPANRGPVVSREYLPLAALIIVALVVAAVAVLLIDDPVVLLGVVAVLVGIGFAVTILRS